MSKIPVFICGGHFSPAFAILEELIKDDRLKIYYLGRKYSQEKDLAESFEYQEISKINLPFLLLSPGRFSRFISLQSLISLFKVPLGFVQGLMYIKKYKPKLIISFGSYVALPVCLMGWIFGIPIITHEQTRVMGLSNRIISLFATFVCLTFSDTKKVPGFIKTITTGIPLRQSITDPEIKDITRFGNQKLPLIYITGGSLGSASINSVMFEAVPELLKKYRILHICGRSMEKYDYHKLSKLRMSLDHKRRENYYISPNLSHKRVGEVLKYADLIIGRSGANTIAEIAFYRKSVIFIPLPWAGNNEQKENALYLKDLGMASIIDQKDLKAELVLNLINKIFEGKKDTGKKPYRNILFTDGKEKLIDLIKHQLKSIHE